mgnify:CR=1 FL=1
MNTRRTAIITALIMLFSSLAGCLDRDEETKETAMVSTYHVGQLVSAIAGDTINVEMMSTANVPVHDYEPSAEDIVRLQESDIFFYHGLNLEPWVSSTLSTLGEKAPTSIQTHTMPTGEIDLAFDSLTGRGSFFNSSSFLGSSPILSLITSKTFDLASKAASGNRSGRRRSGDWGRATSKAASVNVSWFGDF